MELPQVPNDDDWGPEPSQVTPSSSDRRPIKDRDVTGDTPRSNPPGLRTQGLAHESPGESAGSAHRVTQGPVLPARESRSRSPSQRASMLSASRVFQTPASQQNASQPNASDTKEERSIRVTSGQQPVHSEPSPSVQQGDQGQKRIHPGFSQDSKGGEQPTAGEGDVSLEREIERRMYDMMKEENHRLRVELSLLQQGARSKEDDRHKSFETAVDFRTPEPSKLRAVSPERFTPEGTKVPSGPAPHSPSPPALPPVPPFPSVVHSLGEGSRDVHDLALYEIAPPKGKGKGLTSQPGLLSTSCTEAFVHPQPMSVGPTCTDASALEVRTHLGYSASPMEHRCQQLEKEIQSLRVMMQSTEVRMPSEKWGPQFNAWPGGIQHNVSSSHESTTGQPVEASHMGGSSGSQGHGPPRQEMPRMSPGGQGGGAGGWDPDVGSQLKSVPITLPKLVEPSMPHSTLAAGDWVAQLRPHISDVCSGADKWWDACLQMVEAQYQRWLSAGPLDRIHIQAPDQWVVAQGQPRLEQRITTLLMSALPETIRQELVSNRLLHVAGALFTVFKRYQPGGLAERSQILIELTSTTPASSAEEAISMLRMWRRQQNRALELSVQLPDPLLLVKALDTIMSSLLRSNAQATFRINSFRLQHQVDVRPTVTSLGHLYDMLLSEADQMMYSTTPEGKSGDNTASDGASVKALAGAAATSPSKPIQKCRAWGTPEGCKYASGCRFSHDWQGIQDKHARCWNCSSLQHSRSDCPYRTGGSGGTTGKSTAETEDSQGQPKGKGKKGGKNKKGSPKGANVNATPGQTTAKTTTAAGGNDVGEKTKPQEGGSGQGKGNEGKEDLPQTSGDPNQSSQQSQVMSEVTQLLKSLRVDAASQHGIRAMHLCSVSKDKVHRVLIDGGATHVLRRARDDIEWEESQEVTVALATGSTSLRQNRWNGSLLTSSECQRILPMSAVAKLGYRIEWNGESCQIISPDQSKLPVVMDQGCPTVDWSVGQELLARIEEEKSRHARLRVLAVSQQAGALSQEDITKLYPKQAADVTKVLAVSKLFPMVPKEVVTQVPGITNWDVHQLPFNRHLRRKLQLAKRIVLHVFSGDDQRFWVDQESRGTVVLCAEITHGVDLRSEHVFGWLESVIQSGKVSAVLAGPPCRTISVCRARGELDGGPRVVRTRTGVGRFGRDDLSEPERELVNNDSVLWIKTLWLLMLAKEANQSVECGVEQPQDPAEWKNIPDQQLELYPSFTVWPETQVVIDALELTKVRFDQGALGHQTRKPTTMITNIPEIMTLHGLTSSMQPCSVPDSVNARIAVSKALAAWAPGLKACCAAMIKRLSLEPPPAIRVVAPDDLEQWKLHVYNGHTPFRRDCQVCVQTMGRDKQHRQIGAPEPYCMNCIHQNMCCWQHTRFQSTITMK